MKSVLSFITALAAAALLSSCATLNLPGPPGECLRNADNAGRQEGDAALKAGYSTDRAMQYGNGVRNSVRVGCAVLGTIVLRVNEKIEDGMPAERANDITHYRLDDLLTAGYMRNMLSNPAALQNKSPEKIAEQLGEQAAYFTRPYIPKTAAEFRNYTLGWKEVIRAVESDRNIPGAKPMIAFAQESMRNFWSR